MKFNGDEAICRLTIYTDNNNAVVTCSLIFRVSNAPIVPEIVMSVAMGLIVVLKHIENIKRIIAGTESKIGDKKNG